MVVRKQLQREGWKDNYKGLRRMRKTHKNYTDEATSKCTKQEPRNIEN